MPKRFIIILAAAFWLFLGITSDLFSQEEKVYTCEELIEDARQLLETIESSHPDPYINGGGKIAFLRRFQEMLHSIPQTGLTKIQFYKHLLPFVTSIGDSHTMIRIPVTEDTSGPGLPFGFKIIEKTIVVESVPGKEYQSLLGARLLSIENIPLEELLIRQSQLRGIENYYGRLAFLCYASLNNLQGLKNLIPEWNVKKEMTVDFKLVSGTKVSKVFSVPFSPPDEPIFPRSKINLPSTTRSDVVYNFLDKKKQTALLLVENMMRYREGSEAWFSNGLAEALPYTQSAYAHFYGTKPPDDKETLLAAIPSATETFISLVQGMKKAGTKNLIIDLRKNTGGNGIMCDILIYILYGRDALRSINNGYSITKYSTLYFKNYTQNNLKKINKDRQFLLIQSDYDFQEERKFRKRREDLNFSDKETEEGFKTMPSFWNVYKTNKYHDPVYTPEKVIVLCSPFTYSSGFNMLTSLYDKGATIVGTPSAQPGNNFGDILLFSLKNTGIQAGVSFKRILTFPDDPEMGHCLIPHFTITYAKLADYNFDPNAEILLALEILK